MAPIQPAIRAEPEKEAVSKVICMATGKPVRVTSAVMFSRSRKKPSRNGLPRLSPKKNHRMAAMLTTRAVRVLSPAPVRPSSGAPKCPKIST